MNVKNKKKKSFRYKNIPNAFVKNKGNPLHNKLDIEEYIYCQMDSYL
jgi:hypothetical protein